MSLVVLGLLETITLTLLPIVLAPLSKLLGINSIVSLDVPTLTTISLVIVSPVSIHSMVEVRTAL